MHSYTTIKNLFQLIIFAILASGCMGNTNQSNSGSASKPNRSNPCKLIEPDVNAYLGVLNSIDSSMARGGIEQSHIRTLGIVISGQYAKSMEASGCHGLIGQVESDARSIARKHRTDVLRVAKGLLCKKLIDVLDPPTTDVLLLAGEEEDKKYASVVVEYLGTSSGC